MRSRSRAETGAVTAELAVALPAVLLVLAACLGALRTAGDDIRAIGTAALVARSTARGDPPSVVTATLAADPGSGVVASRRADGLLCVTVRESDGPSLLPPAEGRACALVLLP